jgi:uncharacterized membrane protein
MTSTELPFTNNTSAGRRERVVLSALIALCAIVFSYLSVSRHYSFNTAAYDLAMYDQTVWNTSQGRWFQINLLEDTMPGLQNKLGDHVEPILLPLALLYKIRSNPDVLLIVQALALAALIWPLYQLLRLWTRRIFLAGLGVTLYLLHPAMWNALLFDFHPVTLAAACLMFAFWSLAQRRYKTCLLFAILAMMCKEQIGLIVALFGLYTWLFRKPQRRFAVLLVVIGLAWSILAIGVVNPMFQPAGVSYYLNRYGRLGSTFGEVLTSPFTQPDVVWSIVTSPKRVAYYGDLLLPLGGLPLLGIELLLPALPDIVLNTLSAFAPSRTLDYHYAVVILPFLILAAVGGIDRLARWLSPKINRRLMLSAASILVLASMGAYQLDHYHGFLPLTDRYWPTYTITPHDLIGLQIAARIPPEVVVSAQFDLVPHISQRPRAHIFPRIEDATYVFLDTQGVIEPFTNQAEYQSAVDQLLHDPAFEVVSQQDGFILLRRK